MSEPTCPLLHVDMDAFYAAVMIRDRPELHDVPVVVGGGHRSVVLCANYPARRYGVHSGMPGIQARRQCPGLVEVAPDFDAVRPVSTAIMEIFRSFTPTVEVVSLDEAFLDVRGAVRMFGPPERIAHAIRTRVRQEQGLACSVGIAATVSVAKLASRRAKPDGVRVISPARFAAEVHPLDVGALYGVGEPTRQRLRGLGLMTVGDLARVPVEQLQRMVGHHLGATLHRLAHGTDRSVLRPGGAGVFGFGEGTPEGSMGNQHTLAADTRSRQVLRAEVLRLSERVGARLRAAEKVGRTVALTVRYADFTTLTRSHTLREPTDVTHEIYVEAVLLLATLEPLPQPVRLVGVRMEGLSRRGGSRQLVLGERDPGWPDADRAVDVATGRFGRSAVRRASLLGAKGPDAGSGR